MGLGLYMKANMLSIGSAMRPTPAYMMKKHQPMKLMKAIMKTESETDISID